MSWKTVVVVLTLLLMVLVPACAPKATPAAPAAPQAAPAASQAAVPVSAKPAWEEKWDKLVAAAKAEGTVVIYADSGASLRAALTKSVKDRFDIRLEIVGGKGASLAEKIFAEKRAGLNLVDAYHGGATTMITQLKPAGVFDPLEKEIILPEVLDSKNWFPGEPAWPDKDRLMVAISSEASGKLGINTNLVKPGEIKSLKDLLNPKWKGKIIINDPTVSGTGAKTFGVVAELHGVDIWRQLAKQEPVIIRDQRLMVDWLAHGKYAIIVGPKTEPMHDAREAGAPVDLLNIAEVNYATGDIAALINKAPHPNAARVYLNWLLTKEGQTAYNTAQGTWSGRKDVTVQGHPTKKRVPDAAYFDSNAEVFVNKQPEYMKVAAEIFAAYIPK